MAQDFRASQIDQSFGAGAGGFLLDFLDSAARERAEADAPSAAAPALRLLHRVARACEAAERGETAAFYLDGFDAAARALIDATLGEGQVDCRFGAGARAVESVFAGVWLVRGDGPDRIETAPAPLALHERAFEPRRPAEGLAAPRGPGMHGGLSILTALLQAARDRRRGQEPVWIDLALWSHTPEDLAYLDRALGEGSARVLARGYGDCRFEATATPQIWRARRFNAAGALIRRGFLVTETPPEANASTEDFADSAERLDAAVEALR
jgi:hydrogenase-1 operon protein HyaF